jgi:23S rRNA pseudouridine1911/1915/1917 synthase
LEWRFLGRGSDYDLVAVRLLTGRKHQIRVQFAARGLPILGDRKYGSSVDFPAGIALHAWRLTLAHPVTRQTLSFVQGPPAAWRTLPACLPAADLADIPAGDGGRVNQKPALNPVELVRWLMEAEPGADR